MKKKILILAVVALVSVVAESATKIWAEKQLATVEHPIPLSVAKGDTAKTVDDLVKRRFPGLDAKARQALIAKDVRRLVQAKITADKPMRQSTHYFVFHRRNLTEAPRHLFLTHQSGLFVAFNDWLDLRAEQTRAAIKAIDGPMNAKSVNWVICRATSMSSFDAPTTSYDRSLVTSQR